MAFHTVYLWPNAYAYGFLVLFFEGILSMAGDTGVLGEIALGVAQRAIVVSAVVVGGEGMYFGREGCGLPPFRSVALLAFIVAEGMRAGVTVAAYVVQASEVRPLMALEAIGFGVFAY